MRIATPGNLSKLLPEAVHRMGRTPLNVRFCAAVGSEADIAAVTQNRRG
jgi:hypothetical protein